ncbi:protease FtsH-inhibitory lysogeny factor CIII [Escherichia coli]|nr:protease FtsH-inhibitory lysogeny factor CIII [Escherichia coli]
MWLMKTLLTSGCTNQRGAGQITRKLRDGWKRLIDVLNQPGVPKNG